MREINIARVLADKRRERGITQDELAGFMGVSKASVSKWETGQSYPDVTFLPMLAAYFNISIDELMDYKPQMTREAIKRLYRKLSSDFAERPFDAVLDNCRAAIRKYFACFPLLFQMGLLLVNHAEFARSTDEQRALIEEAKALFMRVRAESGDVAQSKKALYMEACCELALGNANTVLELMDGALDAAMPPECLLASAYQMTGRVKEAKTVLQAGIYQNIVVLFNFFPAYLLLCAEDGEKFGETLRRALVVAEAFDLRNLHPAVLISLYLSGAQGFVARNDPENALDMLHEYTQIVTGDIYPLILHGDGFFDLVGD